MPHYFALTQDTDWQSEHPWQTPDTPFMRFEFWQALTDTGAIGEQAGWVPVYVLIYRTLPSAADEEAAANDGNGSADLTLNRDDDNTDSATQAQADSATQTNTADQVDAASELPASIDQAELIAVMPVFIKGHHRGEFVFDYAWAEAYARYGLDYYPRLVTSVPYTPTTGQRFWLTQGVRLTDEIVRTAIAGVDNVAQQVGASSWHGLFVRADFSRISQAALPSEIQVAQALASAQETATPMSIPLPIFERQGCQFLWHNRDLCHDDEPFEDFAGFLSTLKAKKRKTIRAERRKVAEQGITCVRQCGKAISHEHWQAFYQCYVMTYAVRGQQPYLTLAFFLAVAERLSDHIMLAQAYDAEGEIIASSLFIYDTPDHADATLYGRYWGALADYDSLHFELCYYQGIEFAIEQGLRYFDPGTQGEHKLIRGFIPTKTQSLHRLYEARFIPAISQFCQEDRKRMADYRRKAHHALPFNADNMPQMSSDLISHDERSE